MEANAVTVVLGVLVLLPTIKTILDISAHMKKSAREIPAPADTYVRKDVFDARKDQTDQRLAKIEQAQTEDRNMIHSRINTLVKVTSKIAGRMNIDISED